MECAGFYGALGGHPPNKEAIEDEERDRLELRERIERKGRERGPLFSRLKIPRSADLITRKEKQHLYQYR